MPTTYAHDLFGQKVYRQMPDEVKKIIRENGELYRIGLHGPDIFSIKSVLLDYGSEEALCVPQGLHLQSCTYLFCKNRRSSIGEKV